MYTKRRNICTIAVMLSVTLSGCSAMQRIPEDIPAPIIDMQNVTDNAKLHRDLQDCREYALQIDPARGAQNAAIAGALLGLALGSLAGDRDAGKWLAGLGGASAAADTYSEGKGKQEGIMQRCMSGRGYMVIG